MLRRNLILLTLSLFVVTFLAASLLQDGPALAKSSGRSLTHQTPSAKARPDLVVDRVWMGSDCKVRVRVRNAGKGSISPKVTRFDALKVTAGSRKVGEYTFKQVDPNGKLLKPGGLVVFIVPYRVQAKVKVEAIADPDFKIKEANETSASNSASAILVPCRVATYDLPIRVSKVYVKQGTLRLVLSRPRSIKLDAKIFSTLRLKVRGVGGQDAWGVSQFDRTGSLRKRGKAEFDTGLKLKKGTRVHTRLLWKGGSRLASFRVPADLSRTMASGGMSAKRPSKRQTMAPGPVAATTRRAARAGGSGRRHSTDSGIRLFTPHQGQTVMRGSVLEIRYRFTRPTSRGTMNFALYRNGEWAAGTKTQYQPREGSIRNTTRTFSWRLPGNLEPGGQYQIRAVKDDLWSLSDNFWITAEGDGSASNRSPSWRIDVRKPGGHMSESWPAGSNQEIIWRVSGSFPAGRDYTVTLMRGNNDIVMTVPSDGGIRWTEPTSTYSMTWRIPADLPPASDYRISVAHNSGSVSAVSARTFAVTGPITVTNPPSTLYAANPYVIRWRVNPNSGIRSVRIALVDTSGRTFKELASRVPASSGEFAWAVGGNQRMNDMTWRFRSSIGPSMVGHSYAIRISDASNPYTYVQSTNFFVDKAIINVRISFDLPRCAWGVRFSWDAPQLVTSVRMQMALVHHANTDQGTVADDLPRLPYYYLTYIPGNQRTSGRWCFKFRELSWVGRCRSLPCKHAKILVWPVGFEAMAFYSPGTFELKPFACGQRMGGEDVGESLERRFRSGCGR